MVKQKTDSVSTDSGRKNITPGQLRRSQREQEKKAKSSQEKTQGTIKQIEKQIEKNYMAQYKEDALKSFVKVFGDNYGAYLDYSSLKNSMQFSQTKDKNGQIQCNVTLAVNDVKFRSDLGQEHRKFNENSYKQFISNEDQIRGIGFERQDFVDAEQLQKYEEGIEMNGKSEQIEYDFKPVNERDSERFNGFNKINKVLGFATIEDSRDQAMKLLQKINRGNNI